MDLFLVVLGGRIKGCHVELHDVRWVVGDCFDDTIPDLRRQWIGQRRGCMWTAIGASPVWMDTVEVLEEPDPRQSGPPKLWFVNLGAYDPNDMAERHRFGLGGELAPGRQSRRNACG